MASRFIASEEFASMFRTALAIIVASWIVAGFAAYGAREAVSMALEPLSRVTEALSVR
jgi:hypothetical protein